MSMFDNYPQSQDYIPDNRPRCHKPFNLDIMTGETAVHEFDIPFDVEDTCTNFEVIYKKGLTPIIIKNSSELEVLVTENNHSIITCKLIPAETLLFNGSYLNVEVQIKFYMINGETSYSEIYPVKVVDSLDADRTQPIPPKPGVLGGLGYTED